MKVTDNRSGPTVVFKQDTRPGQVYGIGKVFYLKLESGDFASLSTGTIVLFEAMANYLDVLDAEVIIK